MLIDVALAASDAAGAAHETGLANPKFWVGASVVAFLALLVYLGVHKTIAGSLDARAEKIRGELDEAKRLKEEAQALLAQHQRRHREASKEADEIIAHAKEEAEAIKSEVSANVDTMVERRTKLAQERIAAAEAAAVKDVRKVAVEVASSAARQVIADHLTATTQNKSIDEAISGLERKLH